MKLVYTFFTALACVIIQQSHASEGASENAVYQLLQDLWSLMSDANMQEKDALYPITRYAGMGYNYLRGNPEGDFNTGGKDPGIRSTRWIFNLTYSMGREGYYRGKTVALPDQVNFHPRTSCMEKSTTRAYSGQTSYQKELERNVNVGIFGGYESIAKLGFSLSAGMKKAEEKTKNDRKVIIQETKICNLGSVRYKDELIDYQMDPYLFSQGFKYAVRNLPQSFTSKDEITAYMKFIEDWGTHVILSVQIGTRVMRKQSATYDKIYIELSNQKSFGGSLNAGGGALGISASGEVGLDLKMLNKNTNELAQFDSSTLSVNVGEKEMPAPIHLELTPIAEVLSESAWGPTWDDYGIDARQRNLKEALNYYPVHVGAHIDNGTVTVVIDNLTSDYPFGNPSIKVNPKLEWLSGAFALPAPVSGCPEGFNPGSITQDTYNLVHDNSASYNITQRLQVKYLEGRVETNFCVKTLPSQINDEFEELNWPKGSYCIGRKQEECPNGFLEGFIKWDDKDFRNKNEHNGQLPDGEYDKNTMINFCCRGDNGSPPNQILLPTERPFVLYRYRGDCQKVVNMTVVEDYILWNDEFSFNKDDARGSYPDDDGGKKKHKLHYCHYTPK